MTCVSCEDWWDGHIGAGRMRVGAMMNWVDGMGWGVGLGLGVGVGLVAGVCLMLEKWRESCGYTHTALLHLSPPNPRTTPCLPNLPTTAYAPLATPHSHHLAQTPTHHTHHTTQLHSRANSTPTNSTRPSTISTTSVHYPTPKTPYRRY